MFSQLREKKYNQINQNDFKNRTLPVSDTRVLTQNFLTLLNCKNQQEKKSEHFNPKQSATITTKSNKRNHTRHQSVMEKQNKNNNQHKRNVSNYTKAQLLNQPEYLFTRTPLLVTQNKNKASNCTSTIKNGKKRQSNKKTIDNISQTIVKAKTDSSLICEQVVTKQKIITDEFFDMKFSVKQQDQIIINSYYYQNHKCITPDVRGILLDWTIEISKEFNLLRYTFHYAKNIIEIYLSKTPNIKKSKLQLVAVSALFLASKLQQYEPKSTQDYSLATNRGYCATQIQSMQTNICLTLNWKLKTITPCFWVDIFISKWIDYRDKARSNQLDFHAKASNYLNQLYSNLFEIIDVAILDIQSLQYKQRAIVASLLMLILGFQHGEFSKDEIQYSFPFSSKYLFSMNSTLMGHYNRFLKTTFNMDSLQLLPSIQFISSYFFVLDNRIGEIQRDKQSHNNNGLILVKKREQFIREYEANYF